MEQHCHNCIYTEEVHGLEQVLLICANRRGKRGVWYAVGSGDTCTRFRQRVHVPVLPIGVRAVPLTQGKFALVDEADYAALIQHNWYAQRHRAERTGGQERFYAVRSTRGKKMRMHRELMRAGPDQVVDHINHNGLDNRRCNLRVCSPAENSRNQRAQRGCSSRYKGVAIDRRSAKWQAYIQHNNKYYHLGYFESEVAAARVYNVKAQELFGEFAYLNDV